MTINRIEAARTRLGFTAEALCKGILPSTHYSNWKHGKRNISAAKIAKLCERLGIADVSPPSEAPPPPPPEGQVNPIYTPETVGSSNDTSTVNELSRDDDRIRRINFLRVKMRDSGLTRAELDELNGLEGK